MCKTVLAIVAIGILGAHALAAGDCADGCGAGQTGNAVNGINSYPSPSLIRYAPDRDPEDRRIDAFFGDWHESMPRLFTARWLCAIFSQGR